MLQRQLCASLRSAPLARAMRFKSVRTDLFGYEMSSEVGPWNEKISKVNYWNDAGEIVVEMNRANCPPDLSTYKEVMKAIIRCKSKYEDVSEAGESRFCAIMDLAEEMKYRSGESVDSETWALAMQAAVDENEFRAGRALAACVADGVEAFKGGNKKHPAGKLTEGIPQNLIDANEANAAKAVSEGKEFPAALTKQTENLFDIEIKA